MFLVGGQYFSTWWFSDSLMDSFHHVGSTISQGLEIDFQLVERKRESGECTPSSHFPWMHTSLLFTFRQPELDLQASPAGEMCMRETRWGMGSRPKWGIGILVYSWQELKLGPPC